MQTPFGLLAYLVVVKAEWHRQSMLLQWQNTSEELVKVGFPLITFWNSNTVSQPFSIRMNPSLPVFTGSSALTHQNLSSGFLLSFHNWWRMT